MCWPLSPHRHESQRKDSNPHRNAYKARMLVRYTTLACTARWAGKESNLRRVALQATALPLSYQPVRRLRVKDSNLDHLGQGQASCR